MQKNIYVLKMYLFREPLQLSADIQKRVQKGLEQLSLFSTLIYTKSWISAPSVADAPVNDLNLYKDLITYKTINSEISEAALNKFAGHLCYLSPELVPSIIIFLTLSVWKRKRIYKRHKRR
jgi:hypothetical protein